MCMASKSSSCKVFDAKAVRFEAKAAKTAQTRAHKKLGAGSGLGLRTLSRASRSVGYSPWLLFAKLKINLAAKILIG